MNVAKSYIGWPTIGEVFIENKKKYIIVQNPKTGTQRKARVYSDTEYRRMYSDIQIKDKSWKNLKEVLGFSKGYIIIFPDAADGDEWCLKSKARAHKLWGWYYVSEEEIPMDCPHKKYILTWKDVSKDGTHLKSDKEILKVYKEKRYEI